MQEKSQNLSRKQGEESMIWDKMSCINGWMVKSNLVISLVPYKDLPVPMISSSDEDSDDVM